MAGSSWGEFAFGAARSAYQAGHKTVAEWANEAERRLQEATKGSFTWTQAKVDVITIKAADKEKSEGITASEKAFLWSLYHMIGAGGLVSGMPEASLLIRTYVRAIRPLWGDQNAVDIGSEIYETSPRIQREMKRQIAAAKQNFAIYRNAKPFIQRSGKILAEQNNKRMFYADNRFILTSTTWRVGEGYETVFRVDNRYDFEPFQGGSNWRNVSKYSRFPFKGNQLVIYDGLSHYLTVIGLAYEFDYYAEWTRKWK